MKSIGYDGRAGYPTSGSRRAAAVESRYTTGWRDQCADHARGVHCNPDPLRAARGVWAGMCLGAACWIVIGLLVIAWVFAR